MSLLGAEEIGVPGGLIIGLNPPYGQKNALMEKFLAHAVKFQPRLLVLIVPPSTSVGPDLPLGCQTAVANEMLRCPMLRWPDKPEHHGREKCLHCRAGRGANGDVVAAHPGVPGVVGRTTGVANQ